LYGSEARHLDLQAKMPPREVHIQTFDDGSNKHEITERRRKGTKLFEKSKSLTSVAGRLDVSGRQNARWLREKKK